MKLPSKAFAPANISCIFQIYNHADPKQMGSYGLGFTLNQGVTVEIAQSSENIILFNKEKIEFPTLISIVDKLHAGTCKINITSSLPLGCGFGLSGASSLATTYALNNLFVLKLSKLELAKIAHTAEVENKTGLGDVTNQYFGGFLLKLRPSSEFKIIDIHLENTSVSCRYFSQISTKEILSNPDIKKTINIFASKMLLEISKLIKDHQTVDTKIKFSDLISISKKFAVESGLLIDQKVISCINEIEKSGGHASMIMLGNAVFSDIDFPGASKFKISKTSAHLI